MHEFLGGFQNCHYLCILQHTTNPHQRLVHMCSKSSMRRAALCGTKRTAQSPTSRSGLGFSSHISATVRRCETWLWSKYFLRNLGRSGDHPEPCCCLLGSDDQEQGVTILDSWTQWRPRGLQRKALCHRQRQRDPL